eukprot:scaffold11475_cov133-Isochrysis_galbana.AAC.3
MLTLTPEAPGPKPSGNLAQSSSEKCTYSACPPRPRTRGRAPSPTTLGRGRGRVDRRAQRGAMRWGVTSHTAEP